MDANDLCGYEDAGKNKYQDKTSVSDPVCAIGNRVLVPRG